MIDLLNILDAVFINNLKVYISINESNFEQHLCKFFKKFINSSGEFNCNNASPFNHGYSIFGIYCNIFIIRTEYNTSHSHNSSSYITKSNFEQLT